MAESSVEVIDQTDKTAPAAITVRAVAVYAPGKAERDQKARGEPLRASTAAWARSRKSWVNAATRAWPTPRVGYATSSMVTFASTGRCTPSTSSRAKKRAVWRA